MKPGDRIKRAMKWITILFFITTLLKIYYELRLFDLTLGILEVERHNKRAALISKKALMFITRKNDAETAIKDRMKELGWEYVDTFGHGYVFSNEDEEILLKRTDYAIGYSTFEVYPDKEYRNIFMAQPAKTEV